MSQNKKAPIPSVGTGSSNVLSDTNKRVDLSKDKNDKFLTPGGKVSSSTTTTPSRVANISGKQRRLGNSVVPRRLDSNTNTPSKVLNVPAKISSTQGKVGISTSGKLGNTPAKETKTPSTSNVGTGSTPIPTAKSSETEAESKDKESEKLFQSVTNLKALIEAKDSEIEEIKGRLQESRRSREATLEDMKVNRAKYKSTIVALESKLQDSLDKVMQFEKDYEHEDEYSIQVQILEAQLNQTIKMNDNLKSRLDVAKNEIAEKESRMKDLRSAVSKLEKNLNDLEKKNQDLLQKNAQDCHSKGKTSEQTHTSAITILQEQLAQCQSKLDSVKEDLFIERQKNKELSDTAAESKREYGLGKVDLRIATRENRDLTEKISKQAEELSSMSKEWQETKEANAALEQRIADLEKTIAANEIKMKEDSDAVLQSQKILTEVNTKKNSLETQIKSLKSENVQLTDKLKALDTVQETLKGRDQVIQEQVAKLEERNQKVEALQMNVRVLRETSVVLDNQLKEFETGFSINLKEIERLESSNAQLTAECSTLKESLRKTRVELNETKSLKSAVELKLRDNEEYVMSYEGRVSEDLSVLKHTLDDTRSKNEELNTIINEILGELDLAKAQKTDVEKLYETAKENNDKLNGEISRTVKMFIDLKEQNMGLKSDLEESASKGEEYKNSLEILASNSELLDIQKMEKEIMLRSTIHQQNKLIEFLKTQNETLSKKKDKKFNLFSKTKDENSTPAPLTPRTPRSAHKKQGIQMGTPFSTPIEHERQIVRNLEEKCARLKERLAVLHESNVRERCSVQVSNIPRTPGKEDCVLLKSKAGVRSYVSDV